MNRRGAVLPAMLLIAMSLLLLAVGVVHMVRAEVVSLAASESLEQSRMIMRSAVRAVGAKLQRERAVMLEGGTPVLQETIDLFETTTHQAVAVILPLGPHGEGVVAEAGKLDLNTASASMIAATGSVSEREARAIVGAREGRPGGRFDRLDDLLSVDGAGVDATRLYGDLGLLRVLSRVDGREESLGERTMDRLDLELGGGSPRLVDILTVTSFEPDVRLDGEPRRSLGDEAPNSGLGSSRAVEVFFDTMRDTLAERTGLSDEGRELVPIVVEAFSPQSETVFGSDDLIAEAIDGLTLIEGGWRMGLIDINHASIEVVRAIPGLSDEVARAIVDRRETVPEGDRFDRLWPVREGLVTYEDYAEPFNSITTRSLLWRVRIASGLVRLGEADESVETPLVWDVLFDCSVAPPRIVEVTDVSMVELLGQILAAAQKDSLATEEDAFTAINHDGEASSLLFDDPPLFEETALFDEEMLFDDAALFDDPALFDEEPMFNDPPLFSEDLPQPEDRGDPSSTAGPIGRWSPTGH